MKEKIESTVTEQPSDFLYHPWSGYWTPEKHRYLAMSKWLLQNTGLEKRQPSRAHNKGRSWKKGIRLDFFCLGSATVYQPSYGDFHHQYTDYYLSLVLTTPETVRYTKHTCTFAGFDIKKYQISKRVKFPQDSVNITGLHWPLWISSVIMPTCDDGKKTHVFNHPI